jgi:tRNA/tmRNA/rRNA uracil-C5-methylase (TrmA/RlmC/RlmD family)
MQEGNLFLPWYSYSLIDFLQEYLKPNMQIFEFGCGFSTLFYAQKQCKVVAFETRLEWIEKIQSLGKVHNLENNFEVHQCKTNELPSSILKQKQIFDVTIIDSYLKLSQK